MQLVGGLIWGLESLVSSASIALNPSSSDIFSFNNLTAADIPFCVTRRVQAAIHPQCHEPSSRQQTVQPSAPP